MRIIPERWTSESSVSPVSFCLSADGKRLSIECAVQETSEVTGVRPGQFIPELWKGSVVEVFICSDKNSSYQEFNFAPDGAWWSGGFDQYRVPSADFFPPKEIETKAQNDPGCWRVSASIPFNEIWVRCAFTPASRINVCAILGSTNRRYFSLADINSAQPDFHILLNCLTWESISKTQ